jgi:hypothetical protein
MNGNGADIRAVFVLIPSRAFAGNYGASSALDSLFYDTPRRCVSASRSIAISR